SVDSTETPYRYAGYATRLRTILLSAHRYVAYTSDIGESFRPVAHPYLVRTAYGISWTYLIGDVAHEGYKAYLRNRRVLAPPCEAYKDASDLAHQDVAKGMATGSNTGGALRNNPDPRAVFQSIASMGLPAFTIHSVVKYSGRVLKNNKSVFFRTWAPIGLGLSVVPFLPYLFDEPVEKAVEWAFETGLRAYAGEDAVRHLPHAPPPAHAPSIIPAPGPDAKISWDEYKDELRRAKEERKRDREERGQSGIRSMVGGFSFGSSASDSKDKSE
ncbi:hypothetical protein AOCH_007370, partial [Aspergillus ochraceoroseus]